MIEAMRMANEGRVMKHTSFTKPRQFTEATPAFRSVVRCRGGGDPD